MNAIEARELTERCKVFNDERNYDYAISKIIQSCSAGQLYAAFNVGELYDNVLTRLSSDGYTLQLLEPVNLIKISW